VQHQGAFNILLAMLTSVVPGTTPAKSPITKVLTEMKSKTIDTAAVAPKAKAKAPVKAEIKPAKADDKAKAMPEAKAASKPAAVAKPAADTLAIHINKTGRVCFGKQAAARLGESPFCTLTIEGQRIRLEPTKEAADGALPVRDASGRPYISATKQFKPLGFDGSRPYDIDAKPYGNAGFEFRLQ
jgi:hypothetical protein